jgi:pyruvate/2-oxoglutarate dehydrogenase complex dihydrolipoamide acyltransferase (E2) component
VSEDEAAGGDEAEAEDDAEATGLRRTIDLLVCAPMGVVMTVAEDLPGLIAKGRQRLETEISNARIVGKIVVTKGQQDVSQRLGDLLGIMSGDGTGDGNASTEADTAAAAEGTTVPAPTPKPEPDPEAEAIVGRALADYETLSASQVVRRLESLGPEELRAVQRHEASHRNRRTILNRASQLLDEGAAPPADG